MSIEINLLTNIITNFLKDKFKLDSIGLQLASSVTLKSLSSIENFIKTRDIKNLNKKIKIAPLLLFINRNQNKIILISILGYLIRNYRKISLFCKNFNKKRFSIENPPIEYNLLTNPNNKNNVKYYKINVSNIPVLISVVNKFMKIQPTFYKTNINKRIVNYSGKLLNIFDSPVYFNDNIHGVKGYITTRYNETKINDNVIQNYGMILHIEESESTQCYISQIENYVSHQNNHGDYIQLNYYKIISTNLVEYVFYENNINKWKNDILQLENEFFSIHKKYLFSLMKSKMNKTENSNSGWNNMILYGPPGTGKSSFVYRTAVLLKMDILSIDLSLYMDKKKELFSIFHKQTFSLPNSPESKKCISNKYIIILDEFDTCIEKLMELENINKYKNLVTSSHFNDQQKQINRKMKKMDKSKKSKKKIKNKPKSIKEADYINGNFSVKDMLAEEDKRVTSAIVNMDMNDSNSDYDNYGEEQIRRTKNRKFNEDIGIVNSEITNYVKNISDVNKSDILRLSDLLELFQGPVPVKDRIIMATTNNFEKIKNTLPALFRAGRLTPIKFDYLDWISFCELCKYYFNKIPDTVEEINVPTSQIVELVYKYKIDDNFDGFIREVFDKNE